MYRFHASKHVRLLFHSFQRGLPHLLPGQQWYVVSSLINALGSGLYYPFAVLYGHQVVGLSFPLVGLGLTVATGVSLATGPLQGTLVDRFGARALQIAAHLVRAVGFLGFLLAHSFPVFLFLATLVALGDTTPAGNALVADLAAPDERDRWFGLRRVLINVGLGVGGRAARAGVGAAGEGEGRAQAVSTRVQALALNTGGRLALWQGEYAVAERWLKEAEALGRAAGDLRIAVGALHNLGMIASLQGDQERAAASYEETLALRRQVGNWWGVANALLNLANAAYYQGNLEWAAHLLGAAAALRETIGAPQPPLEHAEVEQAVAKARAALGEAVWAAAFAAGRALSLEQAIAEALGETGAG